MHATTQSSSFPNRSLALAFFIFVWVLYLVLASIEAAIMVRGWFLWTHLGVIGLSVLLAVTTWLGFGTRWLFFIFLLISSMMEFFVAGSLVGIADKGAGDPGVLVTDLPSMVALLGALVLLMSCIFIAASPAMGAFLAAKRQWRQDLNDPIAQRTGQSDNKP